MAGRYKPYPEYKDSGVEWLGEVPSHWVLCAAKRRIFSTAGGTAIKGACADEPGDGLYPAFSASGQDVWLPDYKYEISGLVLSAVGARCGKTFKADGRWGVVANTHCLLPSAQANRDYLWYLTNIENWWEIGGSAQPFVNVSLTLDRAWAFPSIAEQSRIASFLDHETAKIDTLIEKQQQLIQLLKEKRQAVISHAVTKGLNPNAKMKDSGIEWLGEVPEHWEVSKFGYISVVVRGGSPRPAGDPALFNGDYSPWVTVAEITKDDEVYLTQTETFLTKKGSDQCRVFKSGTLLLSNSGATLGVPKILSIDANANDGVVGFESLSLNHEFAYFYLSTLTEDIRERIKQGSGQPNLNTDIVKSISVPIPPDYEVAEIVAAIKDIRSQYSELMVRATRGIELLQERRTALISAAVTGKIDVRNWVAPNANQINKEEAA